MATASNSCVYCGVGPLSATAKSSHVSRRHREAQIARRTDRSERQTLSDHQWCPSCMLWIDDLSVEKHLMGAYHVEQASIRRLWLMEQQAVRCEVREMDCDGPADGAAAYSEYSVLICVYLQCISQRPCRLARRWKRPVLCRGRRHCFATARAIARKRCPARRQHDPRLIFGQISPSGTGRRRVP
jgi:hypothetical protein